MIPSTEITGVLLAGGESRRMGRDKATLSWGDPPRPLWRVQLEKLIRLPCDETLISARIDQPFENGAEVVHDEHPGAGPLVALAGCLERARRPYLLPLAVDQPAITPAVLENLKENAGPDGLVFRAGKFYEPFPAIYPRALLPLLRETLAAGEDSMQQFIRGAVEKNLLATIPLPESDTALFKSLNRPEDLANG